MRLTFAGVVTAGHVWCLQDRGAVRRSSGQQVQDTGEPTAGYRVWCCQTATGDCRCYCHNNAQVLAPGGKEDAAVLVANFLGRPYSFDAYEAWLANNQE